MGYEVPDRPRKPIAFGAIGLILLVAAMIPQLWYPEGPISPALRLVALFGAVALLAGALGAFNRWVLADRSARSQNRSGVLPSVNARSLEEEEEPIASPPPSEPLDGIVRADRVEPDDRGPGF